MTQFSRAGTVVDARRRLFGIVAAVASLIAVTGDARAQPAMQTAVLAGGCFWGVEGVYEHMKGVQDVVSGYAGGRGSGLTRTGGEASGFAEAVRITFNPALIDYNQLLQIFFDVAHDPTEVDRQGPDIGPRYRSAIFPQNSEQRAIAEKYLAGLRSTNKSGRPVVTKIETGSFDIAEPEQQDYVRKHPREPYVVVNDLPKLGELKRRYPQLWRD